MVSVVVIGGSGRFGFGEVVSKVLKYRGKNCETAPRFLWLTGPFSKGLPH
jgi:hypothetical protein